MKYLAHQRFYFYLPFPIESLDRKALFELFCFLFFFSFYLQFTEASLNPRAEGPSVRSQALRALCPSEVAQVLSCFADGFQFSEAVVLPPKNIP